VNCPERSSGFVDRFQRLGGVDRVCHDAAAGLNVGAAFAQQRRPDGNRHVHVPGKVEVAHHPAVDPAPVGLEFVEEAQGAGLRGS
jgi:hypothetical protein